MEAGFGTGELSRTNVGSVSVGLVLYRHLTIVFSGLLTLRLF